MKNCNGYGCVVNLGKRRRKPYGVRITTGFEEGVQKYQYVGFYATKKEAVKALSLLQVYPVSPKASIKFHELFEEWNPTHYPHISKETQYNYDAVYAHLKPLHNLKFADIRTARMQLVLDNVQKSKSTKTKMKLLLNKLYKYAMQNDIVHKNYAEFIRIDREARKEKDIFTDEEIKIFFENDDMEYVPVILILIYTGMRISELLILEKIDVDMQTKIITGGLKTDAGKGRKIPIHPKIEKYVTTFMSTDSNWLISRNGCQITSDYFRKHIYYDLLKTLGVERKTPHVARHTFATLAAKNGMSTLAIQQILGHTSYAFTADTYSQKDISFLSEQMNKF